MAFQGDSIFWVEVEKVVPNPFQPRREFDEQKLKELSESVRMYGILQPLTVTRREVQAEDGSFRSEYELIAGERRLRASKLAGLAQVPVIIREGEQSEQEKLELAIIENLQREDLNSVDRALAFRQLADVFGLSHSQVATKVGRSREYVSNSIRLLALPDYMLNALRTGDMSEGHGRTLLMLNDRPEEQDTVFREILLKKLSVREVERIARSIASEKIRKVGNFDADLVELEKKFTETLGTRVSIVKTEFGGRLSIDYFTASDLEQILERMKAEAGKAAYTIGVHVDTPVADEVALGEPLPQAITSPINDELLILTNSTGLELVPEEAAEETVVLDSNPLVEDSVVNTDLSDTTESVVEDIIDNEVEIQAEKTVLVEQDPVLSTTGDSILQVEALPTVEVAPLVAEASELAIPTPAPVGEVKQPTPDITQEPVVPVTQAVTQTTGRVSLRDQLAQLLRQSSKPITPITPAAVMAATPEVVVPPKVAADTGVGAPLPEVAIPPVTVVDSDDDNLYDLKSFSI